MPMLYFDASFWKCLLFFWSIKALLSHRWCVLPQNLPPAWLGLLSCLQPHCYPADYWRAWSRFPLPSLSFTVWPRSVYSMGGEKTNMELWVCVVYCNYLKKTRETGKQIWHYTCFSRVLEGVEYFLDLLASLHSDEPHGVRLNTPTRTNV